MRWREYYSELFLPLRFQVHKEKLHIEFYCLLNSSCDTFTDLIIHRATWQSCSCCYQSFKLSFRFNKIDHKKSKSMNTKAIVGRKNWRQFINYLWIINFTQNDSYVKGILRPTLCIDINTHSGTKWNIM